ncbi:MAG TPA: carboxypeptidase regulatory-like domain-containing protein [Thermoanaerobaculia bacterium]|jgi:hypothetical protein|nr:carboxypeptidase regulatory-like domain-containing protein [Thermoanaerobaculia bacterium]
MKRLQSTPLLLFLLVACAAPPVFGQAVCSFSVSMVNHNRYAYDTAEECSWPHSVPFGNWGVSSNVGSKRDADQFKGWNTACSEIKVEWNSCSRDYVKPDLDCRRLNFPDPAGTYPYPANGYPFTDSYGHNNYVPAAGGNQTCVDQYSPCGPNVYGTVSYNAGVSPIQDLDGDNILDAGGCKDLDGYQIGVQQNFMTVYELDPNDSDDVINSLYFPNVWATLRCTPESCYAVNDNNYDGWIDDIWNQFSPEYVQPYLYQDNQNRISYSTDPGVLAKRIDATIRIGLVSSRYSGPYPAGYCAPGQEEDCLRQGGAYWWDQSTCTCRCAGSPSICPPDGYSAGSPVDSKAFSRMPGKIAGRLVDRGTGKPLAGEVAASFISKGKIIFTHARTSERGDFVIDGIEAGQAYLTTKLEGYAVEHQSVSLRPGETKSVELSLVQPRSVRGTVRDSEGRPLSGALVKVIQPLGTPARGEIRTTYQWETGETYSDERGNFAIPVHPGKSFVVEASHSGFAVATSAPRQVEAQEKEAVVDLKLETSTGPDEGRGRIRERP